MKKLMALILAAVMLCAVAGAWAEEGQLPPLYQTVGEALEDDAEGRVVAGGCSGDYYAVVTRKDGRYYRSVAVYDDTLTALEKAVDSVDFDDEHFSEKLTAAMSAADEYRRTLPIAYTEEFTALPLTEEDMAAHVGKTLAQLQEEGFETVSASTEGGEGDEFSAVYALRYGVFDYACVVDADEGTFSAAQENGTEDSLTVKSMALIGVTEWGFDKRYHTDGTVEAVEDPFTAFSDIMTEIGELIEKSRAGEEIDMEEFASALKARFPDHADSIDFYIMMFQNLGVDGFASFVDMVGGE